MMKDILLATEIDKLGNKVEIYQATQLAYSPAYTFFLKQYVELIEAGHAFPLTTWDDYRCGMVYAKDNTGILGVSAYDTDRPDFPDALYIILAAVDESAKFRGIYTMLCRHRENAGIKLGKHRMIALIHVNNQAIIAASAKTGWKPVFQLIGKKLPEQEY